MNNKILFTKCRDVKSPNRGTGDSAGIDFFIPKYNSQFYNDLLEKNKNNSLVYDVKMDENYEETLYITIPAGEQINVPSGIKVNIQDRNTYLDAENKSGIATKYHLICGAKVVDADYRGEIHINLLNVGNEPVVINTGMKAVQFIHKEYIKSDLEEISLEDYNKLNEEKPTERGAGGFSSTGLK